MKNRGLGLSESKGEDPRPPTLSYQREGSKREPSRRPVACPPSPVVSVGVETRGRTVSTGRGTSAPTRERHTSRTGTQRMVRRRDVLERSSTVVKPGIDPPGHGSVTSDTRRPTAEI